MGIHVGVGYLTVQRFLKLLLLIDWHLLHLLGDKLLVLRIRVVEDWLIIRVFTKVIQGKLLSSNLHNRSILCSLLLKPQKFLILGVVHLLSQRFSVGRTIVWRFCKLRVASHRNFRSSSCMFLVHNFVLELLVGFFEVLYLVLQKFHFALLSIRIRHNLVKLLIYFQNFFWCLRILLLCLLLRLFQPLKYCLRVHNHVI